MLKTYFPEIELYQSGFFEADSLHTLYWEQSGNPNGTPVVFLHGGPGGGASAKNRRLFDPQKFRIIIFDQRGCGRSLPTLCLTQNTTWDLCADIEKLRIFLGVEKWVVFGGSWGCTLALTYAICHPQRILQLIVRGVFLCSDAELNWAFQSGGLPELFPDVWQRFIQPVLPEKAKTKEGIFETYLHLLHHADSAVALHAAWLWVQWEAAAVWVPFDPQMLENKDEALPVLQMARTELHYFSNRGFFKESDWILKNAHVLNNIPGVILHGRFDVLCPAWWAWQLHKAWPTATLHLVPEAGHGGSDPLMLDATLAALNQCP